MGALLNAPDDSSCPNAPLRKLVRTIYQGIMSYPDLPLWQNVPKYDWNATQESMAVRPHDHCFSVSWSHLSGLYSTESRKHFDEFIEEFS